MTTVSDPTHREPFVVHDDGEIIYANDPCLLLFGAQSADELVGVSPLEFITDAYHQPLGEQFTQLTTDDGTAALGLTVETAPQNGDGGEVVVITSPIEWNGEEALQSTFIDIGDQLTTEGLFEHAMDAAPVGITIADATRPDEPLIYVSEEFAELTGYDRSEALGQNCRFLQGEETREEPVRRMREAIAAAEPVTVVLRNYRKDGSMFWNRVTITPITDKAGELTHFLGYQEDVSEMKRFEHEKSIFEKHAEAAPYAMFITDREGRIEYVNPAFERVTGYDADEAIGENPRLLKSDRQDETFYSELWKTITAGDVWTSELTNRRKTGELYQIKQTIVPITNEYDEVTHFAAIERDISETEFTEQVLDVINRILRHNLRTSINVIEGYAEILEEIVEDDHAIEAAKAISERTERLETLSEKTTDIRELFEDRDRNRIVDIETITGYVTHCRRAHPEATITVTVDDMSNDFGVKNGPLLQIAIQEAIENAVKHTDDPEPTVDVTLSRAHDPGELVIEICDNGPGIPKAEWDVITANQETPLRHASGIGLWLIYWGVTALGGAVELQKNGSSGNRLTYYIPLVGDTR